MKIGFIGCGNMATAILKGILKSGEVAAADIIASAITKSDRRQTLRRRAAFLLPASFVIIWEREEQRE